MTLTLKALRRLLERFWIWLGGELPSVETGFAVEPGPGQFIYVVRPGDTLRFIARRFSTSVWILADLNGLDDHSLIHLGQQLLIPRPGASASVLPAPSEPGPEPPIEPEPGPFIYIVQRGDTLSAIARRFGKTVTAIVEHNRLQDPNLIRPGQRVLIPGPEPQREPESTPPAPEPEPLPLPLPEPEPVPEPELPTAPAPATMPEPEPVTGHVYVVRPGDSLMVIARRFNVTVRAIIEANDVEDPNLLQAGQRLIIPGVSGPPAPPPAPEPEPEREPTPTAPLHPADTSLSPIPWSDDAVRAIYVSYLALGQRSLRRHVIDLLTKTEINALVIDVKGDSGLVSYPTHVPLAHDIGAAQPTAHDFDELMDFFKANGVYTIARIVTFKDNPFASGHPEWAAQREGGGLWHDREKLAWADPFAQAAWEYNADLSEEAARCGFDEVQFDCVRFPTRSQEGTPRFSQPLGREARVSAVTGFLSYVRGRLASLSVLISANVSGYACWRQDDTLIGQELERMAQYLGVLCPMLYPSVFGSGIPGYRHAIAHPYEIVYESTKQAVQRVGLSDCRIRPWIQDFPDRHLDKGVYGPAEVRAQMQGSFDGGGTGYMAWDARVKYTTEAYFQNAIDMSLSDDYN